MSWLSDVYNLDTILSRERPSGLFLKRFWRPDPAHPKGVGARSVFRPFHGQYVPSPVCIPRFFRIPG